MTAMAWNPGQQLQGGKYTIDRVLGVGGFGITYLAFQNSRRNDQQPVVIKTLKEELRLDPKWANYQTKLQQDFLNEALKLAKCHHPHIVEVQEIIREGYLDCIVMEFVEGESLEQRLSNSLRRGGPLLEAEALRYIQQVGEALIIVHNRGLLHRDIKPQNIIIRSNTSEAVLIDFGLAREFMQDLTQTHSLALTHGFAPPEQYNQTDKRGAYTDVYALAATLYCLLTGHTPPPAFMRLSGTGLQSPKQLNPQISDRVNKAILRGLELKTENRPQSMRSWLDLLAELIVRPVTPPRVIPSLPANTTPPPSSPTQNRTPAPKYQPKVPRRRSRTIPWEWLNPSFFVYAALGTSLSLSSALAGAVTLVLALVGAVTVTGGVAGLRVLAVAGTLAVAATLAVAVAVAMALTWVGASILAVAGTLTWAFIGAFIGALAGEELLDSFSRFHTFLILAGTSLAGLGMGWLVRFAWHYMNSQITGMV